MILKSQDKKKKQNYLKDMTISEVSLCGQGMNPGAYVSLFKSEDRGNFEKKATKREQGKDFVAGDYAYVPDKEKSSTWKLRLTNTPGGDPDKMIVGMAVAALGEGFRGQKVQLPSDKRKEVVARVRRAWLAANKDKTREDLPSVLKSLDKGDEEMSDELKKAMDAMEKRLADAEAIAKMNDKTKEYFYGLSDDKQADFLKKSVDDQKKEVGKAEEDAVAKANAAKNDETMTVDGNTIRKSEVGEGVFRVLQSQQSQIEKAEALAKVEKEKRIVSEFAKMAEGLYPNLPGKPEEKGSVLKAFSKMDDAVQNTLTAMLKAGNEAINMAKALGEHGYETVNEDSNDPLAKLNKLAMKKAEADSIDFSKAYDLVLNTKEGKDLYEQSMNG